MESRVIFCDLDFKETPNPEEDPLFQYMEENKLKLDSAEFDYLKNEEFKERFRKFLEKVKKYKASGKLGYSILYGEVMELTLENGVVIASRDLTPGRENT